ncbi:hypothetical protein N7492_001963 [Penicillium capsulatum]|uniref:Berberine/berberine-like domain-containing protein n=1 Tax=Penicillium capsulatum TaxID=69766 RepID=A0A9W9IGP6_9EURO|nr:hypothetical protein N7492_001963 [Penicillium capsulatum]KAJ6123415.1 hypothetical protein N7512_005880 [Penicillium capsulatum]
MRTFPEVPFMAYNFNITTAANDPRFWDTFAQFNVALPSINDGGGSGYYLSYPNLPLSGKTSMATLTNLAEVNKLFQPLKAKLQEIPDVKTQNMSIPFPSIRSTMFTMLLGGSKSDVSGDFRAWRSFRLDPNAVIWGHTVAGGAVAANWDKIDNAVNPAWRKAVTHMLFGRGHLLEHDLGGDSNLRSVEGAHHMGAYLNEACPHEPEFQASFRGENYPRLYSIKQKWNPRGLFIVRKGVGSEDGNDDGLCMVARDHGRSFNI